LAEVAQEGAGTVVLHTQFPPDLKDFDSEETTLHEHMIEMRHTIYAHSDSKHYTVKPWRTEKFSTDIIGAPWPRITGEEAILLKNDKEVASCNPSEDENNCAQLRPKDP
jgi:hypothetical protein